MLTSSRIAFCCCAIALAAPLLRVAPSREAQTPRDTVRTPADTAVERPFVRGIYASEQRGFYLEGLREILRGAIRALPDSTFALKARFDYVDFDRALTGTSIGQISVGLNVRRSEESVLKLDLVRGRGRDTFNNAAEHAFLLASIATYF